MADEPNQFATEQAALEWVEETVGEHGCVDNFRIGYKDDPASMTAYDAAQDNGCCGSTDHEVEIAGRPAWVGCNFGH